MKDVLNSLGGMELLFPILENVRVPLKQLPVDNKERDETNGLTSIFNGMYMYMCTCTCGGYIEYVHVSCRVCTCIM